MIDETVLERDLFEVGNQIARALPTRSKRSIAAFDERAMELASQDAELKAALFRFVDVAPACRNLDDLARHLAGFVEDVQNTPPPLSVAMRMSSTRAGRTALGAAAAAGVKHMAHRFIIGETPESASPVLKELWNAKIASSVDLLGEATVTQSEAERYAVRCSNTLTTIEQASRDWREQMILERDSYGELSRTNLSVKVSALTPLLRAEAPERGQEDAKLRVRSLLRQARDLGAHLHIDMESFDSRDPVLGVVLDLLGEPEFQPGPSAGIVLQAYLRDSPQILDAVETWLKTKPAKARATPLSVRLVKGAYWDHEVVEAQQRGWSSPVFEDKAECDLNFELLTRRLIDARPHIRVAVASHNLRSLAHAIAYNRLAGGHDSDVELQVLRGLGDDLAVAIASLGLRVRMYCPIGDLVAGMAYLVRRLLENTSNESFLYEQARGVALEKLLDRPVPTAQAA